VGVGSLASHWVPVKEKLIYKYKRYAELTQEFRGVGVWISRYLHYYFSMVLPTENPCKYGLFSFIKKAKFKPT
jgi:hypothetical protein